MPAKYFEVIKSDPGSKARIGVIHTGHGDVHTPAFLPIGTKGTVKSVTSEELRFWGADMILANTYHLWQRPGDLLIYKAGGLHKFMNWKNAIFTDSGGYQVFSLAKLRQVSDTGVLFRFDLDGREMLLTPEKSVQVQVNLGSDIALVFDDFPGYPFEYQRTSDAIEQTRRWTERAVSEFTRLMKWGDLINPGQKLWGIVQGASFEDLRKKSAQAVASFGFEGYAIGGVAVGEPTEEMLKAVDYSVPHLEPEKPKHLLGVGTPYDIVQAVARGCDTFDCVIPTREARHGKLYIAARKEPHGGGQASDSYTTIDIRKKLFEEDFTPVDNTCDCYGCLNHTRAYLRHLFINDEPLAIRLATMHNLRFYLNLMKKIRNAIQYDFFPEFAAGYEYIDQRELD